ncbi:TolC family protein [Marinifilum sp.]|uniref:TolC family protein n=1 Tax=Marinifilum sp. TaxID=2033137 RepID=UPI003BAD1C26
MKMIVYKSCASLLIYFAFITLGFGQQSQLSLEQIHEEVQQNYPLIKGKDVLIKKSGLNIENLRTDFLPKLYANGKMSYQSDVITSPLSGSGSFGTPKDQFSLNLDVEQLIYNGERTKSRIKLEQLSTDIEVIDLEVRMYELRKTVNDAFFTVLLLRQSHLVLLEKRKSVDARLMQVHSAVKNGVIAAFNAKVLESELLSIDQQINEIKFVERTGLETLAELMGRADEFKITDPFTKEEVDLFVAQNEIPEDRPEYKWYKGQNLLLDEKIKITKKDRLPVITAFGQLGYGQPGYNQLNDNFDSYYMLGAKLSWNIFDWKSSKRSQRKYQFQKDLVATQLSSFRKIQKVELRKEINNISKFKILLEQDDAIISLQEEVTQSSSSRLDNGVITSSDYLEDLNKEIQAKLNRKYHEIQLSQAISEYKRILGITKSKI